MSAIQPSFPLNATTAIPAVGFGTYLISNDDAPAAVCAAIANGYRHIDAASGYQNETAVGEGIRLGLAKAGIPRDALFVTTKLWPGNPAWGDAPKTGAQTIAECAASLERLGLDYVDLYLIHAPYGGDMRLEQWRALLELQKSGRARSVGVSNFNIDHLEEIRSTGLPMPDVNQIELHPWSQKPELLAYMAANGIAPIAYSSLVPLSTWRTEPGQDSAKTDEMKADGSVFAEMAKKYGVTEAQLLLRWGVQNGYAVLPKSLNPDRMRQNIDLFSFAIDDPDMTQMAAMDRGDGVAWASGDPSK
ncbi:aldo/keto reductase [Pseudosulfitobacter sp. DSM 107133]|uniref:aldo/keto reductase n=1 Tax=Pseudosulfitobacter sp. DSM 107133 TaxID=2883100 RepID=UPI000DF14877|nr:aldo/keto reductase [Pseudosulfitobacter sp. DSM 107133]UOA26399.1 putative oxidoreductase [Pseudosulfitobacter sp. DSM 107133]